MPLALDLLLQLSPRMRVPSTWATLKQHVSHEVSDNVAAGNGGAWTVIKTDIFDSASDVDAVSALGTDNARALLGVDTATMLPGSARLARQAKVEAGSADLSFAPF